MSIYLHFADKRALLDAVVEEIFAELHDQMIAAAAGIEDPVDALCAEGSAYVGFALDHPGAYRYAMLQDSRSGDGSDEAQQLPADGAFRHFVAAVTACMENGAIACTDPIQVSLEIWTVAHGLAALLVTNPSLPWGDEAAFVHRVLRSGVLGHATNLTLVPQVPDGPLAQSRGSDLAPCLEPSCDQWQRRVPSAP